MSDFYKASLELARLRLCRITNESTKTENCYQILNRELRWLWNAVALILHCLSRVEAHGVCVLLDIVIIKLHNDVRRV